MNLKSYKYKSDEGKMTFEFESVGPMGTIFKMVKFIETPYRGIFNLGFGDYNVVEDDIDDRAVSNNGDLETVLSTVVAIIFDFFDHQPHASIYISGSTAARTRLYRMAINKYYDYFISKFDIHGELNAHFECFSRGITYKGYLIKLKQSYEN